MFKEELTTRNVVRLEDEYNGKVEELIILQNWRDILTIKNSNTEEIFKISSKELNEELNEQTYAQYGKRVSIIKYV